MFGRTALAAPLTLLCCAASADAQAVLTTGELERPLAIVMIGGLITSTLLTLPAFYSVVVGLKARSQRALAV